eukprot:4238935-Heterocapsa_arctica.AAC.1
MGAPAPSHYRKRQEEGEAQALAHYPAAAQASGAQWAPGRAGGASSPSSRRSRRQPGHRTQARRETACRAAGAFESDRRSR